MKHYCYHITDGITRSAIQCGTVAADSMESAAVEAAARNGLRAVDTEDFDGLVTREWRDQGGAKRNVYVLHDPAPRDNPISAAPELLEAVGALVSMFERGYVHGTTERTGAAFIDGIDAARAALLKAKGGA